MDENESMVNSTSFVYIVYKPIEALCRFKPSHMCPQIEDENKVSYLTLIST